MAGTAAISSDGCGGLRHARLPSDRARAWRAWAAVWFVAFAILTRLWTLGDLSYQEDELLFFLVGQRMHDGMLPYVDLWDRKPTGLFAFYYLLAAISSSISVVHVAASLSVAATGYVIALLAREFASAFGAVAAGTVYAAAILQFGGGGGQAAVFYNLAIAISALLVLRKSGELRRGRIDHACYLAMVLAGIAISFKQTAIFEGGFLGLYILWLLRSSGVSAASLVKCGAGLALAGALPMLAVTLFFALQGHFAEFWHAMVTANLAKQYDAGGNWTGRLAIFAIELAPLLVIAVLSLRRLGQQAHPQLPFLYGWLAAAAAGFLAVPNLIDHYVLPLLVPLSLAGAALFARRTVGPTVAAGLIALYLSAVTVADFGRGFRSAGEMTALAARIEAADPAPRLLVFDGPVYLYQLTGSYPVSPLIFPLHTNYRPERNVSHLDTATEFRRMLAIRPTTVVWRKREGADLYNPETLALVRAYISARCRASFDHRLRDLRGPYEVTVHTGCGRSEGTTG